MIILCSLLATLSVFPYFSRFILFTYLKQRGDVRGAAGLILGFVVVSAIVGTSEYFNSRFAGIDLSAGLGGLDTGVPRLLPYVYVFENLPAQPWFLVWGSGAGTLDSRFFIDVGQYYTDFDSFSVHMAGAIFDYGLPIIFIILFSWGASSGVFGRMLFIVTTLFIFLNTGIGTYLFIIFGTFALLERRFGRW